MSNNTNEESSDSNFYLTMLAAIVGMGFYISYDVEKRYGAAVSTSTSPVVVESVVEKTQPPILPEAVEMVIEETPLVPEQVVEEKTVVAEPEPVAKESIVETTRPAEKSVTPVGVKEVKATEVEKAVAPVVSEIETTTKMMTDAVATEAAETMKQATKYIPVPVPVPVAVPTTQRVIIKSEEPAYQPYAQPYGRPYQRGGNYYQQQNPYNSPYGNYYQQPYGGGYNPYQQQ